MKPDAGLAMLHRAFVVLAAVLVSTLLMGEEAAEFVRRAVIFIGIIALAVQARVTVGVLVETLMVHPSLSESITDAAE